MWKEPKNPTVTSWWPPSVPVNPYPLTDFEDTLSGKRELPEYANFHTYRMLTCV